MTAALRELLQDAEKIGWELAGAGTAGNSHLRLRHPDVNITYVIASTPSDRWAYRIALADLERLAGRRLPRPNAGRCRHRRQPVLDTTKSTAERIAGAEVDRLIAEARELRARFDDLPVDAVDDARDISDRYGQIRRRLAGRFRIIPTITALEMP